MGEFKSCRARYALEPSWLKRPKQIHSHRVFESRLMNLCLENRHPPYSLASTVQRASQRSCVSQRCSTHVSPHGIEVTRLRPWGYLVSFSDNLSFFSPSLMENIWRRKFSSADSLSFTQVRSGLLLLLMAKPLFQPICGVEKMDRDGVGSQCQLVPQFLEEKIK